jgi:hypothetical protein
MVASALEKQDLVQRLEKQLESISSLHKIDQAIAGNFDIKVFNQIILKEACKRLDVDAAIILHINLLTNTLDVQGSMGLLNLSLSQIKVPVTTSIAGKALMERGVFQVADLSTQPSGLIKKNGWKMGSKHILLIH